MFETRQYTDDVKFEQVSRRQAQAAQVIGRLCRIAWISGTLPDYEERGKRSHLINSVLKQTRLSRPLINTLISPEYDVIGIGGQSVVVRENETTVRKFSIPSVGDSEEQLALSIAEKNESARYINESLGTIAVSTVFDYDSFRFRFSPYFQTISGKQDYVRFSHDIFTAPDDVMSHDLVQTDMVPLLSAIDSMRDEGRFLDINGPNNIVVSEDETGIPNGIRIIDTDFLGEVLLTKRDKDGISSMDRFLTNRTYLESHTR